jgi:hypothetical protein
MATYYVRPDGNDSNTGLGPATNLAWRSLQKALGATGATGGDIVYIAPGHYNEAVTVGGTYTSELQIVGDPTSAQFSGIQSGFVKLSQFPQPYNQARNNLFLITGTQNFLHFKNIYIDGSATGVNTAINLTGSNVKFTNCAFINNAKSTTASVFDIIINGSSVVITRCVFFNFYSCVFSAGSTHKNNLYLNHTVQSLYLNGSGHIITNCTFIGNGIGVYVPNTGSGASVYNSLFIGNDTAFFNGGVSTHANNRYIGNTINVNNAWILTDGGGNVTNGTVGIDLGYASINNITSGMFLGSLQDSQNIGTGNTIASLPTDIYGTTWYGATPDIGAITYRPTVIAGQYNPTERTNNSFTVSPNTTNRSELIYLGAKGLTHTTPSLSASYVRAGAIRTAITLVSQTPNGSWTSGGFCEIDSVNMPGIYRIDVPNAVFVAGAESAMLQLTGLNTSNGAVVHYNMAKVQFDLSQNVPLVNTAHSIGDALNAARAQGFGKWQIVDNTMNIYAEDGITLVKSFNLDSGSYPTQRM